MTRNRGGRGGHEPRERIRARETRAAELAALGWPQHRIAAELGVSQPGVSRILRRVDERVLAAMQAHAEREKGRQTSIIQHLYREVMEAWENSKKDLTKRRQRKGDGAGHVAEIVMENRHGDPRYIEQARKLLADHRKLWGLEAPQRVDVRAARMPYADMSDDDLRAELARQTALLEGRLPVGHGQPSDGEPQ